nr:protein mono-ADP-ribosyltransferase PARP8-like isoform X2 [Anas platyrhynchos]
MGICSRQERIQKAIDVVIEKCKAEKDYLFTVYPFQCMSLKTTQVSYDGELHKHPQLEADLTAMREIYGPNAVSLRRGASPFGGSCLSWVRTNAILNLNKGKQRI